MLKSKKISLLLTFILLISVVVVVCSSGGSNVSGKNVSEKVIEISYGHGFMPDTPHHQSALKFKEEVEKATDGRVKVNVFPSGQLGSAREMFEGLQMGTQEIALVPTARISGFAPELQLFDLPYLFPDRETGYKIMDGEVGSELLDKLAQQGVKGVAFYEDGYKHFTANKSVATVNDFKGVKFRTMESPIIISQFKALGAVPVPIDFGELYNSLQLGVVEGQENPLVTIESNKFYEVQSHITLSGHAYLAHVLIFSNDWFNNLPEDIQNILYEKGREIAKWQRQAVQDEEVKYLQTIKDSGTTVIELTDEQKNELMEATKVVHEEYSKQFGSEILEKTYEEIKKYQ